VTTLRLVPALVIEPAEDLVTLADTYRETTGEGAGPAMTQSLGRLGWTSSDLRRVDGYAAQALTGNTPIAQGYGPPMPGCSLRQSLASSMIDIVMGWQDDRHFPGAPSDPSVALGWMAALAVAPTEEQVGFLLNPSNVLQIRRWTRTLGEDQAPLTWLLGFAV
jgi:hypothetical protein